MRRDLPFFMDRWEDTIIIGANVFVSIITILYIIVVSCHPLTISPLIQRMMTILLLSLSFGLSLLSLMTWMFKIFTFLPWISWMSRVVFIWILTTESALELELLHCFSPIAPIWTKDRIRKLQGAIFWGHLLLHFPHYIVLMNTPTEWQQFLSKVWIIHVVARSGFTDPPGFLCDFFNLCFHLYSDSYLSSLFAAEKGT
jgi:hypothetical protein